MRIRTIKPEFWISESVGRLSRDARLLFIGLWNFSDDSGRARGALSAISGSLFPYDSDAPKKLPGWFAELEREGMVVRYVGEDGNTYLELPNFLKHQKINRPSKSRIPERNEHSLNTHGTLTEDSLGDLGIRDQGSGNREQGKRAGARDRDRIEEDKKLALTFLKIFNQVFDRDCGDLKGTMKSIRHRMTADDYAEWQILISPIMECARDPGVADLKNFGPTMLLRDGRHPRTGRDGHTTGAVDWLERLYSVADTVRLDERLTAIAEHFGLLDDIKRTGAKFYQRMEATDDLAF